MYKSLNKSLQIIRPITINLKNHNYDHYAMMLIFQNNVRVRGGLQIRIHAGKGKGGKNGQKFADFIDGPYITVSI